MQLDAISSTASFTQIESLWRALSNINRNKIMGKQCCSTRHPNIAEAQIGRFFFMALRPNAGLGLYILEVSRSQRRITVGRTPLDEWSARRRDLYPTTHNTYNRQTSMPPVGFELTISAGERPHTYALGRAATGTGKLTEMMSRFVSVLQGNHIIS